MQIGKGKKNEQRKIDKNLNKLIESKKEEVWIVVDGWTKAEVYIGGFRLVGTYVDFGEGVQSEPLLFALLLIFIAITNSGGCSLFVPYAHVEGWDQKVGING